MSWTLFIIGLIAIIAGVLLLWWAIHKRKKSALDGVPFLFAIPCGLVLALLFGGGTAIYFSLGHGGLGTPGSGDSPIVVRGGSVTIDPNQEITWNQIYSKTVEVWQAKEPNPINEFVLVNPGPQNPVFSRTGPWRVQIDFQKYDGTSDRDNQYKTAYICSNWSQSNPTCDPSKSPSNTQADGTVSFIGGIKQNSSPVFTRGRDDGTMKYALKYDIKDCDGATMCDHPSWITITDQSGIIYGPKSCAYNTCVVSLKGP